MLAIDNLTVAYPGSKRPTLNHLGLVIDSSACILGPSGAGKSTLLNTLIGVVPAFRGSVWVEGVSILRRPFTARRLFAYMPQGNTLPRESTVAEYLTELARLDGYPPPKLNQAVEEILNLVHLTHAAQQRLKWLSGGMKRRAMLASALLRTTPWLLLDEPTLGLDPDEQASVRSLIRNLSQHRRVILATQVVEDARAIPNRTIILDRGRMVRETQWKFLADEARDHVFSVDWTDEALAEAQIWAPQAGSNRIRVFSVQAPSILAEPLQPTAEDGYLWILSQSYAGGRS